MLLLDMLGALHCASFVDLITRACVRVWDDYKLNRKTAKRVAQMKPVERIGIIR